MKYSVGIGITNKCNLNCPHCYSREKQEYNLRYADVKKIVDNLDVDSINFGTGESILCDDFNEIIELLHSRNIKMSLTTNGYTVSKIGNRHLKYFNDIDFSLDFPEDKMHDAFRNGEMSELVRKGISRCQENGVQCSIAMAMMNCNYKYMDKQVENAQKMGVSLRVNVYKPVNNDNFKLTYEQFWEGIRLLFLNSSIVSCSEPIVNALIGNKVLDGGSPCGKKSLRIKPDGTIVPCVYMKESSYSINEYIDEISKNGYSKKLEKYSSDSSVIPDFCQNECQYVDTCKGGCYARRYYNGDINEPDEYCFVKRKELPNIKFKWGPKKDLVHSEYLCTIIVC